ncbi:Alkyltransferase-like protein Atl1 [Schizosaccharomyces pombe]|uniref:Alkyltransferase-like protein 1 n=2 Tax=Schizosaccharomyces pombe TaxID=4896 RepID=ATL1_SCHPO|nr:alkyltransferase-like protein Atl1 [Schizosaccharomyces pombe]Q9UTN9.1 RecName: Full=Alkyltransferase-like protein 1 [Schizosaccharomyces pombe 972h-]CAB54827.1 alkyltransferase-like protein Atl1 [Schizosaccharomyces pombe]|eukprot:NP_594858.1 alkyltransferase-like protein Atl1 [Schizosaccharomyces pombe]
MRMDEFYTKVYDAVCEIPYGKVSTYGEIARYVGMPSYARQVGQAMKHLHPETHVPWHRVINSRGTISKRDISAGEQRQKDRLEEEGVEIYQTSLGEYKLNLPEYMWKP